VTSGIGAADAKPAAASSAVGSFSDVHLGVPREYEYQTLGCITRLKVAVTAGNLDMHTVTQKDAAKIGVTPRSGGTIPRYALLIDN
jgi:hypothetical protein